jgi:hypothetical protein
MGKNMTQQNKEQRPATAEELYEKHKAALDEQPVLVGEPPNGGPRLAHFFTVVGGIGQRTRERGSIVRTVRARNAS